MRKVWNVAGAVAVLFGIWAGQAAAVNTPDYDIPYVAAQYSLEFGDSARDSDDGDGYQLSLGFPLEWTNTALELTFADLSRNRNIDGNPDYQTTLMANLVRDFGLFGWESKYLPKFKPFVLVGLGAVQEDVQGDKHLHIGGEAGGGLLLPTGIHGLALRADARALLQQNDKSAAGEDMLLDYRVSFGLQLPLTPFFDRGAKVAPAADCELAVVDVSSGRRDCAADSDHDGVADSIDQCPGTPTGTIVDTKGCPQGDAAVLKAVEFNTGSADLTEDSKIILDGVAATLLGMDVDAAIEIGGHTDGIGNEPYNLMLSEQRAEVVKQYLIAKGLSPDSLQAHGYGKYQPLGNNQTDDGRQVNRRVEFKIVVN